MFPSQFNSLSITLSMYRYFFLIFLILHLPHFPSFCLPLFFSFNRSFYLTTSRSFSLSLSLSLSISFSLPPSPSLRDSDFLINLSECIFSFFYMFFFFLSSILQCTRSVYAYDWSSVLFCFLTTFSASADMYFSLYDSVSIFSLCCLYLFSLQHVGAFEGMRKLGVHEVSVVEPENK